VKCIARDGKFWYSGILRCADCGEPEVYFSDIPEEAKKELDHMIEHGLEQVTALKDQYDQEALERYAAFDAYVKERDARA